MMAQNESVRRWEPRTPPPGNYGATNRKLPPKAQAVKAALTDPERVLGLLGLLDGAKRQALGYMILCLWHSERTPSCSVKLASYGIIAVYCHGCGQRGDVLTLIAAARGLDIRRDFGRVVELGADLAGGLVSDPPIVRRALPAPRLPPSPDSVRALWEAATPVTDDAALVSQLAKRCLDPAVIEDLDLARAMPSGPLPRWAWSAGKTWLESGHRLLIPLWDTEGNMVSVHARTVEKVDPDQQKGLFPSGHSAKWLFFADSFARLLITKGIPSWWRQSEPPSVIITEGAPDFLTVATHYGCSEYATAVLGILSGSWSDELAARIPTECRVIVKVHRDEAGQKYRDQICRSLSGRCRVFVEAGEVVHV